MNWHTRFTAKDISSHVNVRYYRAPIILQYNVGSDMSEFDDALLSLIFVLHGDAQGLQFIIEAFERTSIAYFSCERKRSQNRNELLRG